MNIIAVVALFLPIAVMLFFRLSFHRTFPLLLFYYAFAFGYNLMSLGFINFIPAGFKKDIAATNNLLDGPLILAFLTYLCYTKKQKILIKRLIAGLLILAVLAVAIEGYNNDAARIVMGPAFILILFFSVKFFNHFTKLIIRKPNSVGKTIMSASMIFCYSIYGVIYLLFYVFKIKEELEGTFLVYFLATIFASGGMAMGIYYEATKIRRIKEIKLVRKELAVLYADENNSPGKRSGNRVPDELFGFDPSQVIPGFRN